MRNAELKEKSEDTHERLRVSNVEFGAKLAIIWEMSIFNEHCLWPEKRPV